MVPIFPHFKCLELEDKKDIDQLTKKYPLYADFNFLNLLSWNIYGKTEWSVLNSNLVVKFTDYLNQHSFFSFFGSEKILETTQTLIQFSVSEGFLGELRLIPEYIAEHIKDTPNLIVKDDLGNADYILSTEKLKDYEGSGFANKRNHVKNFKKGEYTYEIKEINLNDKGVQEEICSVFNIWTSAHKDSKTCYEEIALKRYLEFIKFFNTFTTGVYIDGELEAFWSHELLDQGYTMSHFEKANAIKFSGLYPFLVQETAEKLFKNNYLFINFEQDLGIEKLREGKKGYLPVKFYKKFTISKE